MPAFAFEQIKQRFRKPIAAALLSVLITGVLVLPISVAASQPVEPTTVPSPEQPGLPSETVDPVLGDPLTPGFPDPLNVVLKGGSTTPSVNPVVIGAVVSLAGVCVASMLNSWRSKRERQGDRKLKAFDDLILAIEDLDAAYVAVNVGDPSEEANSSLMVQTRKFERKVRLVSDEDARKLAEAWELAIKRYTVASDEPEESAKAPTHQQVIEAQHAVLDRILMLSDKLT